ncbi:O-antigen ligase family protein [Vibrio cholerae]|nr:O-antigen ligase domain-containing protein [Vibrio cholerae]EGR4421134.1 O-antigen ligase domain-containing protein [Vibrio cholerae]EGR4432034.1 O-antigen ligase domain-containing protein [Vibrio cholerae]HAS5578478.1 O-antigen ligase family protein [Vibrio cholerae]
MLKNTLNILNVNAIYIAFYIMGYPIFAIASEIFGIEVFTIIYRALILTLGLCVFILSILKNNTNYTGVQIFTIFICLAYGLFVLFYFSNGYINDTLNSQYFINNLILFTLVPLLLFSFSLEVRTLSFSVQYMYFLSIVFLVLIGYSWLIGFSSEYRLSFEKLNPISLSMYSAISVIVVMWHVRKISFKSFFMIALFIYCMILSGSRGPLLSLFLMTVIFSLRKADLKTISISLLSILTLILVVFEYFNEIKEYMPILNRFDFLSDEGSISLTIRERQYSSAIDIFMDNPILGGSLVEKYMNYYPHNLILEILMVGGLVFFLLYALYAFFVIRNVFLKAENEHSTYLKSVIILLIFSYMTSSSLASIGLLFFLIILASKNGNHIYHNS